MKKKKNNKTTPKKPLPDTQAQSTEINELVRKIKICARTGKRLNEKNAIIIKISGRRYPIDTCAICHEERSELPQIKARIEQAGFTVQFMTNNKKTKLP